MENYKQFLKVLEIIINKIKSEFRFLYKLKITLNFKTVDPYYLEINKTNYNYTNRFERNVPLMKKIKNDNKSNSEKINHKNKNKIKKSFNITIRDINHSENLNKVIEKYPGSYYLAIQQYVEKVKINKNS